MSDLEARLAQGQSKAMETFMLTTPGDKIGDMRGLVLHFGIEFGADADKDDGGREPNPNHEASDCSQLPVCPVVASLSSARARRTLLRDSLLALACISFAAGRRYPGALI